MILLSGAELPEIYWSLGADRKCVKCRVSTGIIVRMHLLVLELAPFHDGREYYGFLVDGCRNFFIIIGFFA